MTTAHRSKARAGGAAILAIGLVAVSPLLGLLTSAPAPASPPAPSVVRAQRIDPAQLPEGPGARPALTDADARAVGALDLEALYAGAAELAGEMADGDTRAALAALPALDADADPSAVRLAVSPDRPGQVIALGGGSPHLWIGGEDGKYHWAGDSRALQGKNVLWSTVHYISAAELQDANNRGTIGDPYLSLPLLLRSGDVFLPKWEQDQARPTLLHIRSIADVQVFGVNGSNYGRLVKSTSDWERETGLRAADLPTGALEPAVAGPSSPPTAPQPQRPVPGATPAPSRPAPAPSAPAPAEDPSYTGFVTRQISGVTYTFVPHWWVQSWRDDALFTGLIVASTVNPDWRGGPAAQIVTANTDFNWGNLGPNTHGSTNTRTSTVYVNTMHRGDTGATAAVLAHEVYHAVYPQRPGFLGCMQDEANAFSWGIGTWSRLPTGLKLSSMAGEMNGLVTLMARAGPGGVLQLVQGMPSYQAQCAR